MIFIIIAYFAHVLENTLIVFIMKDIGPYIYIPLFHAISTVFVFLYAQNLNAKNKTKVDWNNVAAHKSSLIAYIGGALIGNALWFFSIYMIGVATVSFILIFVRLLVAAYAYLFMNDRYPIDKIVAFSTAFIALIFYSYNGLEENWVAIVLALVACLAFSAERIGNKKLVHSGITLENMVFFRYLTQAILFGLIFLILLNLQVIPKEMLQLPSTSNFLVICFTCLMGSIGTNVMLFYGLKTVPLSTFEALNSTKPVLFSIIGILILNESMTINQIVLGIIIVLSSLYFVLSKNINKQS